MKIVDCPKVTVVIATFNVGRTISSAIESLINQTYPNWECLVIDGGSKDNTIDILKLYKQKESRVDLFPNRITVFMTLLIRGGKSQRRMDIVSWS